MTDFDCISKSSGFFLSHSRVFWIVLLCQAICYCNLNCCRHREMDEIGFICVRCYGSAPLLLKMLFCSASPANVSAIVCVWLYSYIEVVNIFSLASLCAFIWIYIREYNFQMFAYTWQLILDCDSCVHLKFKCHFYLINTLGFGFDATQPHFEYNAFVASIRFCAKFTENKFPLPDYTCTETAHN